jgi:hypothetical protein
MTPLKFFQRLVAIAFMGDPGCASVTGRFHVVDLCSRKVCEGLDVTLRPTSSDWVPTSWVGLM